MICTARKTKVSFKFTWNLRTSLPVKKRLQVITQYHWVIKELFRMFNIKNDKMETMVLEQKFKNESK